MTAPSPTGESPPDNRYWLPRLQPRLVHVWQRNFLVYRKLLLPSLVGNFGEPLLYLFLLGLGLGRLVGEVEQLSYMVFLASGLVCSTLMFAASFEAMYSAFTRMTQQYTWNAMLNTPLTVDDIAAGETLWAATKGLINAVAILIVAGLLGLIGGWGLLLVLPVLVLAGVAFAALALVVTAVSPSYDFFLYYFTLALTPMLLLSGVFFPLGTLPPLIQAIAHILPLLHAVELIRPLITEVAIGPWWPVNVLVLAAYATAAFVLACRLLRRRLAD